MGIINRSMNYITASTAGNWEQKLSFPKPYSIIKRTVPNLKPDLFHYPFFAFLGSLLHFFALLSCFLPHGVNISTHTHTHPMLFFSHSYGSWHKTESQEGRLLHTEARLLCLQRPNHHHCIVLRNFQLLTSFA